MVWKLISRWIGGSEPDPDPEGPPPRAGLRGEVSAPSGGVDLDAVWAALGTIVDPEIGRDVVTVGLIHAVREEAPGRIRVTYTLTTPGCPMEHVLRSGMEAAVRRVPGVEEVEMELVWEPAWTPEMIRE